MKSKIIVCICIVFLAMTAFAQQRSMPGRILLRIKPEAAASFRLAFQSPDIHALKFDAQKFSLKDQEAMKSLLSISSPLHISSLKPLVPQHNVVLEGLREHTNPLLFPKTNQNGVGIKETEEMEKLRASEENISRWFELFYDENLSPEAAVLILKKSKLVEFAEPRYRNNLCFIPNDPLYNQQYSLPLIHAPEAWDIVKCDSTMLVADDDIGTDWTHPDLANAIFVNKGETGLDADGFDKRSNGIDDDGDGFVDDWHGWDFAGSDGTSPDNDPNTLAAHGTHTAGIIAASGNNGIGICGVAFGAKLLPLKCGDNGGNDVSFGYEGIVYAADMGAKVVNNSWGGSVRSQVGQDIVNYANAKNCVVVAASGNGGAQESADGRLESLYPGAYDHVLGVAAVDQGGSVTSFSNYNTRVDVSAPGNQVISTVPGNQYASETGTSMASPTAAGAIALIRQKFPTLTADQAIERLRVTSDPLDANHDPHPGFSGRGLINLQRAVTPTDNPYFSARLESVEIFDQNNNGTLESGESADIVLHVRNYLGALTNLIAKVEFLDTSKFITANAQTVTFGKANTLSLVENFQGSLHVTVAPNTPNNYVILVKLTFFSTTDGYGPDADYFPLIINKGYLDLNKNNLTVTFDSKGSIGYNDPPNNIQGSGFVWTHAPTQIAVEGRDILSQAGLMIATDTNQVVASAPSAVSDVISEQDFSPIVNIHYVSPPDHLNAAQELHTIFADINTAPSLQAGVQVEQKMYAFTKDLAANAIVLDYVVHKRLPTVTDATAVGLFMDWDIGSSGSINKAYISSLDSTISITKRLEDLYPYVGIKLISDIPSGAALNFYALDNDGSNGSVPTYGGLAQFDKWLTLTTPRASAGIGDVSMIYGLKNLPLQSQDSVRLTFIIAMAESEQLLKKTIDQTQNEWSLPNAVHASAEAGNALRVSPNPFGSRVQMAWNNSEPDAPSTVTISDAIGRTVFSKSIQGQMVEINRISLPSGAYSVTVRQGNMVLRQQVICLP